MKKIEAGKYTVATMTSAMKRDVTLSDLRKFWHSTEESTRRSKADELYRIFSKDWKRLLKEHIRSLFTPQTWEKLNLQIDTSINLLRWASDELAAIYVESPTRTLEGYEEQSEALLEPYLSGGQLDLALDQACRMTWALREVAIRPLVVADPGPRIVLDVVPPSKLMVIPNPLEPVDVLGMVVQLSPERWSYWDRDVWLELDPGFNVIEERPNPYGEVPYVFAHATYPVRGFWHENESQELLEATYNIGVALTEWNHTRRYQSFKQVWVSADKHANELPAMLMDPAAAVTLRGGATIGTVDLQSDLAAQLDTILKKAEAALVPYGLRPEQVRGTIDASSGYALSIKLLGQERAWGRQRRVWQVWESKLYSIARRVLKVHTGIDMPDANLVVDWAEIGPDSSPNEEAAYHSQLVSAKIESRAFARRKLGFTEEESRQIEAEILEESLADVGPGLAPTEFDGFGS